ncbi:MAG: NB-ARC domain-containing protein, partial [Clostridiales bacterium]
MKGVYNIGKNEFSEIGGSVNYSEIIHNKKFDQYKIIMQTNLQMISSNFTGREKYIKAIDDLLDKKDVIVLSGNGGIGKTQIVLKYIKLHKKQYNNIAFVNCSSKENIIQEYSQLLSIDNDENTLGNMKHWAGLNKNYLFIYDNLDDEELKSEFFNKYMISAANGKIIITSRLKDWENIIEINKFEEIESIEFLTKKTKLDNYNGAKFLSKELDNFPLALEQAGAYIKNSIKKSYENYIEKYKKTENR